MTDHHGSDDDHRVFIYERDFYPLSNFSAFRLAWRDLVFDTSEAAYQWEKFHGHPEVQRAIHAAPSAHDAFRMARQSPDLVRSDWMSVRVDVMLAILRAKVCQHSYVRQKLLQTGHRRIIEDSWRDDFWGWGEGCGGQNMLGQLWMEVRSEIRAGVVYTDTDQAARTWAAAQVAAATAARSQSLAERAMQSSQEAAASFRRLAEHRGQQIYILESAIQRAVDVSVEGVAPVAGLESALVRAQTLAFDPVGEMPEGEASS